MSRLYDLFQDWKEGVTYPESPLFYAGFNERTVEYANRISDELREIAKQVDKVAEKDAIQHGKEPPTHIFPYVPTIHEAMKTYYGDLIEDDSTLLTCFTTNSGYVGLRSPTKEIAPGQHIPDFSNRYFSEDLPYSLCLAKGIADMVDCPTPFIDSITLWAQKHMNKEYIVDGKLQGKDAAETPLPHYGISSLCELLHYF